MQGFSGALSDKLQKRKSIALAGYLLAAVAKPLMGLSTVWQGVFGARLLDRIVAGTRSAPRDALIASSVDEKDRGRAFGLEGFGDNAGAFLGPLLAIFLLYAVHVGIRLSHDHALAASTARCSLRQLRRARAPCFSCSHSPAPYTFNPVLSISTCRGPSGIRPRQIRHELLGCRPFTPTVSGRN